MITSKEQAQNLIRKFKTAIVEENISSEEIYDYTARQCSIIHVKEMLGFIEEFKDNLMSGGYYDKEVKFWKEVLKEIKKQ